ncbi:unnamed protein product [Phytophthora fragariaefolia]|uniref:Unnamed protein product n=1 Tax=Phytophthora fragariaefolia TaxID=1490495 RepID=A0A9W7D362_9STRA|nr:unnamed protein product [Phytophthora fragariaefolia]
MPMKIDWRQLAFAVDEDSGNGLIDSRKTARVVKVNTSACSVCTNHDRHTMNVLVQDWEASIGGGSPRKAGLSRQHKQYCEEFVALRVMPVRVRNALRSKFGLDGATLPRLRAVQNFVNYYSKTQLGCNDNYDEILKVAHDMAYSGGDDDSAPFLFTHGKNSEGDLSVGDGSDSESFVAGITSRTLLKRLDRDPDSFIFHLDATFKLSQVGYTMLVLGISDRARVFHLVAFIIISQRFENIYTMALIAVRAPYAEVTGKQFRLRFVMGDAEDGQLNALEKWSNQNQLRNFALHFTTPWLNSRYSRWQWCYVKSGFATTNSPVEQFNRVIKRDYTLKARLKMGLLIKVLSESCFGEGTRTWALKLLPEATTPLMRRTNQRKVTIASTWTQRALYPHCDRVRVQSRLAQRFYIPAKKRTEEYLVVTAQMGWNYARMGHEGQPVAGWLVDVSAGWCQCKYWRKFGCCIHLLYARNISQRVNSRVKRVHVNRSIVRDKRVRRIDDGMTPPGRPMLNGYALAFT